MRWFRQLVVLSLLAGPLTAQQQAPLPFDAKSYPLRDSHQGATVAVDPYLTEARAKTVFDGHAPNQVGVLPLEVILTNDTNAPIRIDVDRCQLILSRQKKLEPLPVNAILWRMYRPELKTRAPLPMPGPPVPRTGKKGRSSKDMEAAEADFRSKLFQLRRIAPHSSARGFLFFDVGKPIELPPGAIFYVPEIVDEKSGEPLLYFEISLAATPARAPSSE